MTNLPRGRPHFNKTEAQLKCIEALDLRVKGYTIKQISEKQQVSLTTVHTRINKALRVYNLEKANEYRAIIKSQLEEKYQLLQANLIKEVNKTPDGKNIPRIDLPILYAQLKVLDQLAKIMGIYDLNLKNNNTDKTKNIEQENKIVVGDIHRTTQIITILQEIGKIPKLTQINTQTSLEEEKNGSVNRIGENNS